MDEGLAGHGDIACLGNWHPGQGNSGIGFGDSGRSATSQMMMLMRRIIGDQLKVTT